MKYINKLTKKQEKEIPNHVEKWISIGLKTGKTDWETFEKNIKICYEKANIKFPNKIIRVSSPLVGALAASISESIYRKYIRKNGSFVGHAVNDAVGNAVDDAVHGAVYDVVRGAVRGAVHGAVRGAVHGAVRGAVDGAVGNAVRGAVHDAVHDAVRGAVHGAIHDAVYDAVDGAVGGAVDDAKKIISKLNLKIDWHHWFGGQFWVGYWHGSALQDFFINICDLELSNDILKRFNAYKSINESVNYFWTNSDFVMVCARPVHIYKNEKNQLHCDNDMAIKYPDGWGLWMLNGVRVNEYIVMTPSKKIDCNIILKEKNAEIRKEIIKKVGIERVIKELGAKSLEKNNVYELLNFDCIDGRFRPYLKMINPSTGYYHVEGVHPDCNTIEEALAWRNGLEKYEKPQILT